MILLIDIGNSRIKWVLCQLDSSNRGLLSHHAVLLQRGDCLHSSQSHPSVPSADVADLACKTWGHLPFPQQVVIASVAGEMFTVELIQWMQQHWECPVHLVKPQASGFGVRNAYQEPYQMGVDRWVVLIAAKARSSTHCCIVDCGTAVTIDALNGDGQHLGGVIFPGPTLMRQSLYEHTHRIPSSTAGQITVFGTSTRDAVWGGTVYAVTNAIAGITQTMATYWIGESLISKVHYFLTGGDAQYLYPYLVKASLENQSIQPTQIVYQLVPDLLFEGLSLIATHQKTVAENRKNNLTIEKNNLIKE